MLCSVDVAVIIFGHNRRLHEFSSRNIDEIVHQFQSVGLAARLSLVVLRQVHPDICPRTRLTDPFARHSTVRRTNIKARMTFSARRTKKTTTTTTRAHLRRDRSLLLPRRLSRRSTTRPIRR